MGMLDRIGSSVSAAVQAAQAKANTAAPEKAASAEKAPTTTGYSSASSFDASKSVQAGLVSGDSDTIKVKLAPIIQKALEDLKRRTDDIFKNNRPESLDPKNELLKGDYHPYYNGNNELCRNYQTGDNVTAMPDDRFKATGTPEEAVKERAEHLVQQKAIAGKMTASLGHDVANPPSLSDTQAYFQKLAGKGTPGEVENMKKEYADYTTQFYAQGASVTWGAKGELANDLEKGMAGQPTLKDGRKVIDCEGYAALNEQILGKIKDPSGKPMFELQQVQNGGHIMTAVFRRGEPTKDPFIVNTNEISPISADAIDRAKTLAAGKPGVNPTPGQVNRDSFREFLAKQGFEEQKGPKGTLVSAKSYADSRKKLDEMLGTTGEKKVE